MLTRFDSNIEKSISGNANGNDRQKAAGKSKCIAKSSN